MGSLGAMVAAGMAPDSIDQMDIEDLQSWFEIMQQYRAEVDNMPGRRNS